MTCIAAENAVIETLTSGEATEVVEGTEDSSLEEAVDDFGGLWTLLPSAPVPAAFTAYDDVASGYGGGRERNAEEPAVRNIGDLFNMGSVG